MRPVTLNPNNVAEALKEIERASHEADTIEIAQNFTFDNAAFTQAFQLLTGGSATLANTNQVLATLLLILQKGGLNRTT